jgi:prepilin peptidase CpaA
LFAVLAWRGNGFGWGDVKLMAVVGAVFGYPLVLSALVFISLAGALQAVVALIWQGAVWDTLARGMQRVGEKLKIVKPAEAKTARRHIPYAVAIALGSAWAMWWDRKG